MPYIVTIGDDGKPRIKSDDDLRQDDHKELWGDIDEGILNAPEDTDDDDFFKNFGGCF